MTKREAAIVSAYTGYLCACSFGDVQLLGDELMGRPTWTHEYGDTRFAEELKQLAKPLFVALRVDDADAHNKAEGEA